MKHLKHIYLLLFLCICTLFANAQAPSGPGGDPSLGPGSPVGDPPAGLTSGSLVSEANVTITMDLQPVLQLKMDTPKEIAFTFDDITSYISGIIKYGASILKVSSTVSWDLYAVASSTNGEYWDNQVSYGVNPSASSNLPLSLLEIRQYASNSYYDPGITTGNWADYSSDFAGTNNLVPGQNNVYYSLSPYLPPDESQKYIQGHSGVGVNQGAPGATYLVYEPATGQVMSDCYFVIDYRIVPGLPAIFPTAGDNLGNSENLVELFGANSYAQPGTYSMNLKFVLVEDQ